MEKITLQRRNFRQGAFTPAQRVKRLQSLAVLLKEQEDVLYAALYKDLGKSQGESFLVELFMVYNEIKLMSKKCKQWSKPRSVKASLSLLGSKCTIEPQPYGQVLIISPWNYPIQLALIPLIGAIAAGNCVVLKLSESAKHTNLVLKSILSAAFPEQEVLVYDGGKEINVQILSHRFDYIFFTGSTLFGKEIMRIAAMNLTPVTLELGGKSPAVVSANCDIEVAAKRIAWGKTLNAGQTCVAPDYLLVEKAVADKLLKRIIEYWEEFYGKHPDRSTAYCKMISTNATLRAKAFIYGEDVIYGGSVDVDKRYVQPTLLRVSNLNSAIMQEEIFAPILPVIVIDNCREAIAFINKREKPLALYVFANKNETAEIVTNTSSGTVGINDTIAQITNHNQPFGGVGASGMGAYHGKYSFDTFTHYRSVLYASKWFDLRVKYPPYTISRFFKWILNNLT